MKRSHWRTWSSAMYSLGLCATSIEPGPQMTVGMSASLEQTGLGGEADLADGIGAGERLRQAHQLVIGGHVEAVGVVHLLEADAGGGAHRAHLRQHDRLGIAAHFGEEHVSDRRPGMLRNSKSKLQSRGTMLSAVPPLMVPVWMVV